MTADGAILKLSTVHRLGVDSCLVEVSLGYSCPNKELLQWSIRQVGDVKRLSLFCVNLLMGLTVL